MVYLDIIVFVCLITFAAENPKPSLRPQAGEETLARLDRIKHNNGSRTPAEIREKMQKVTDNHAEHTSAVLLQASVFLLLQLR